MKKTNLLLAAAFSMALGFPKGLFYYLLTSVSFRIDGMFV